MNDQNDPNAQQSGPQTPAAGYYPDAQGVQRYWDGSAWTEHTQQIPAASQAAAASAPTATRAAPKAEREWFKKKRFMIPIGLVVVGIIGSAVGGGGEADPAAASSESTSEPAAVKATDKAETPKPKATKAAPKPKPKIKVLKVTAAQMLKDYDNNELAADKKYKGKTIQVTGVVSKIDTELFNSDKYVLQITDGDEYAFLSVNCNDMSDKDLSTLTVGNDVTAIGKFDDGGDLGIELKKCKLA